MVLVAVATPAGTIFTLLQRKSMGQLLGYWEPSGAVLRNRSPSWAKLEAEASSGLDKESGALTASLSNCFHISDKQAARNVLRDCPRRVSMNITDTTRYIKTVPEDWTRLKKHVSMGHGTAFLALICEPESALAVGLESAAVGSMLG